MTGLQRELEAAAAAVEGLLGELLAPVAGPRGRVVAAMRHGALNGGKRLRPFLVIASAQLFEVDRALALRSATALEMVHCYSLIHDDLPAMDDSDLRRGQPSVHKAFDDATAVLAGDGLLTEAFALLAQPATHPEPGVRLDLIAGLARAAGVDGMVGGQMIDLAPERRYLDLDGITELQALKTGALIAYACEAGAILGQAGEAERRALLTYAHHLGLAFQIVDDLLDWGGSADQLGKPVGQDAALGKATFVGQLGAEGARTKARHLIAAAKASLDLFQEKADLLRDTATFVLERRT